MDRYRWRVGTGFLSTPFILYVLADIDLEYAYRLLENEQMPGWLYMPKMGANTVWESWEGTAAQNGIGSLNHYSKGAVCEWNFSTMCGIRVESKNTYVVEPKIGGTLTYAVCEYNGVFGKVKSEWHREGELATYRITVPANVTVRALLPDGEHVLTAGEHLFRGLPYKKNDEPMLDKTDESAITLSDEDSLFSDADTDIAQVALKREKAAKKKAPKKKKAAAPKDEASDPLEDAIAALGESVDGLEDAMKSFECTVEDTEDALEHLSDTPKALEKDLQALMDAMCDLGDSIED